MSNDTATVHYFVLAHWNELEERSASYSYGVPRRVSVVRLTDSSATPNEDGSQMVRVAGPSSPHSAWGDGLEELGFTSNTYADYTPEVSAQMAVLEQLIKPSPGTGSSPYVPHFVSLVKPVPGGPFDPERSGFLDTDFNLPNSLDARQSQEELTRAIEDLTVARTARREAEALSDWAIQQRDELRCKYDHLIESIGRKAGLAKREHGWCSEIDRLLEDIQEDGHPDLRVIEPEPPKYRVEVTLSAVLEVTFDPSASRAYDAQDSPRWVQDSLRRVYLGSLDFQGDSDTEEVKFLESGDGGDDADVVVTNVERIEED